MSNAITVACKAPCAWELQLDCQYHIVLFLERDCGLLAYLSTRDIVCYVESVVSLRDTSWLRAYVHERGAAMTIICQRVLVSLQMLKGHNRNTFNSKVAVYQTCGLLQHVVDAISAAGRRIALTHRRSELMLTGANRADDDTTAAVLSRRAQAARASMTGDATLINHALPLLRYVCSNSLAVCEWVLRSGPLIKLRLAIVAMLTHCVVWSAPAYTFIQSLRYSFHSTKFKRLLDSKMEHFGHIRCAELRLRRTYDTQAVHVTGSSVAMHVMGLYVFHEQYDGRPAFINNVARQKLYWCVLSEQWAIGSFYHSNRTMWCSDNASSPDKITGTWYALSGTEWVAQPAMRVGQLITVVKPLLLSPTNDCMLISPRLVRCVVPYAADTHVSARLYRMYPNRHDAYCSDGCQCSDCHQARIIFRLYKHIPARALQDEAWFADHWRPHVRSFLTWRVHQKWAAPCDVTMLESVLFRSAKNFGTYASYRGMDDFVVQVVLLVRSIQAWARGRAVRRRGRDRKRARPADSAAEVRVKRRA